MSGVLASVVRPPRWTAAVRLPSLPEGVLRWPEGAPRWSR